MSDETIRYSRLNIFEKSLIAGFAGRFDRKGIKEQLARFKGIYGPDIKTLSIRIDRLYDELSACEAYIENPDKKDILDDSPTYVENPRWRDIDSELSKVILNLKVVLHPKFGLESAPMKVASGKRPM